MKIHSGIWKLEDENLQNGQFWPKNVQILTIFGHFGGQKLSKLSILAKKWPYGPDFVISEFSQHIEYDFLKEDHKNNFHTKN